MFNLRLGQHDSCLAGVLDSELCLSVLSCNTTNGTGQVVAVQGLDILDLEGIQVQIIQTKQSGGILEDTVDTAMKRYV